MSWSKSHGLCRTYQAYRTLGATVVEGPKCRVVRQDDAPIVHDVNHLQVDDDVESDRDLDLALAFLEDELGERDHRQVLVTPHNSPALEARLTHEGYVPDATLQGLLEGPLLGPKPVACDIRPIQGEGDWQHLDRLVRLDHDESGANGITPIYSQELTRQIQLVRRIAASEMHFFLVWDAGEPVAFFSSWPGIDGVGMVEDLYTLPSHRQRGLARALIHHCVDDARERGADAVLIGSEPKDTPKAIYAAMGFRPLCLTWNWLRSQP